MSLCPRCAHAAPEGARFCPACGGRLGTSDAARFASPGTYTPPHLAQRILDARAAVEGERKQVTVLFADIHGLIDVMGDRDAQLEYRDAVADYVSSFDIAEAEAIRRRRSDFSREGQQRLARAQSLLRVADSLLHVADAGTSADAPVTVPAPNF